MSSKMHMVFKGFERDDQLVKFIEKKFSSLKLLYENIIRCRVTITKLRGGNLDCNEYKVSINLVVPCLRMHGRSRDQHVEGSDVYTSISEAFDSLGFQMKLLRHHFSDNSHKHQREIEQY
ncbi:MAG: hypothetical protein GY847_22800 [Proteobacteria bacterium]|nr:hypothetical protein [Pseudomonadota bacterium]